MVGVTYRVRNQLSSPARDSALLDDNGALASVLGHDTSDGLESTHISSAASTHTAVLGRGVDGNQDHVGLGDGAGDVGAEEQVALARGDGGLAIVAAGALAVRGGLVGKGGLAGAVTGDADNVVQAGLVDGRVARVPAADAGLVAVNDGDLDVRVLEGNDGCGRATWRRGELVMRLVGRVAYQPHDAVTGGEAPMGEHEHEQTDVPT